MSELEKVLREIKSKGRLKEVLIGIEKYGSASYSLFFDEDAKDVKKLWGAMRSEYSKYIFKLKDTNRVDTQYADKRVEELVNKITLEGLCE